jgi:hypothetical protein
VPYIQRYVSEEPTHFVGRGKPPDEQYRLLVLILQACELRSDPSRPPGSPAVSWTTLNASFSEREMYHFPGVCFCDIPVADLPLHIDKYSPFGIAFSKRFLVKHGASPVFYIAKDSEINPGGNADAGMRQSGTSPYTRAILFDEMTASFHEAAHALLRLASTVTEGDGPKARELANAGNSLAQLAPYLDEYVFSYCVPFDSALEESHQRHFYMEREWRVRGEVRFTLADVERVVLPREYATQFRSDLPLYEGQITFPA